MMRSYVSEFMQDGYEVKAYRYILKHLKENEVFI